MKILILKIFSILILLQTIIFAEPSKEQTINFIEEKFEKFGKNISWSNISTQLKIKLICKPSGICEFKYWSKEYIDYIKPKSYHYSDGIERFNLKNLDFKKIDIDNRNNFFYVKLYCKDEQEECINTTHNSRTTGDLNYKDQKPGVYFYIKYKSQAIKVKDAFIHLIKLYDKKELF